MNQQFIRVAGGMGVLLSVLFGALLLGYQPQSSDVGMPTLASLPTDIAFNTELPDVVENSEPPEEIAVSTETQSTNGGMIQPVEEIPLQQETLPQQPNKPTLKPQIPVQQSSATVLEVRTAIMHRPVAGQMVVQFTADTTEAERLAYIESVGGEVLQSVEVLNTVVIRVDGKTLPDSPAVVQQSEPNYVVSALYTVPTTDPLYTEQWSLPLLNMETVWDAMTDLEPVTVAVIDSGVCYDHPDLAGRILDTGYDFVDDDTIAEDLLGHGCGVTGVLAANVDNGIGIAGVAPMVQIMPLRVLDASGFGTYADVAEAIIYAVDNGASIINLSLGGVNPSSLLENAVNYAESAGVTVIAAAGNNAAPEPLYPARYDNVVAVGSLDEDRTISSFSNLGADAYAPGRNILTTGIDGDYVRLSGTSLAAPHVVLKYLNLDFSGYEADATPVPDDDGTSFNSAACDPGQYEPLLAQFLSLKEEQKQNPNRVSKDRLKSVAAQYIAAIEDCYEPGEDLHVDDGGLYPPGVEVDSQYSYGGTKWGPSQTPGTTGGTVTYSYMSNGVDLTAEGTANPTGSANTQLSDLPTYNACFLTAIDTAFSLWQAVADIQFTEVADNGLAADNTSAQGMIRIGAHPFDGASGTLAHAYFPGSYSLAGDLHFDTAENWTCDNSGINIMVVTTHEIGHSIGLNHVSSCSNPSPLAIMNPCYNPSVSALQQDDIDGAQAIYGGDGGTVPTLPTSEADALIDLYNATNGASWTNKTNWLTGDPCTWYGITCLSGHIYIIDLPDNGLSGTLPSSLADLTQLQALYLYSNNIGGSIPPELGTITTLQALEIDANNFTGTIPSELGNLTNLSSLWLSYNNLQGSIPTSLGNLTNLQLLFLQNNNLSGVVPSSIGNLVNLTNFFISSNDLYGEVPSSIVNLTNLAPAPDGLGIGYNNLSSSNSSVITFLNTYDPDWASTQGTITTSPAPDNFASPVTISALPFSYTTDTTGTTTAVDDPQATCGSGNDGKTVWFKYTPANNTVVTIDTLSSNFDTVLSVWTGTQGNLTEIACNDDSTQATDTQSSVNLNALGGETYYIMVAGYGGSSGLLILDTVAVTSTHPLDDFDDAQAIGVLPYNYSTNTLSATSTGDDPTNSCATLGNGIWFTYTPLTDVALSFSALNSDYDTVIGVYTGSRGSLSEVICSDDSPDATDAQSKVEFSATAYTTYYFHVGGFGGATGNLVIDVSADGTTTNLPAAEVAALEALYNSTNGSSWSSNTGWMTASDPCTWYGVNCTNDHVTDLNLYSNHLVGSIPPEIGNLTYLETLDMRWNLLSGTIPVELGNLTNLQYLDFGGAAPIMMYDSMLSGVIPLELGNLTNLQYLNLGENLLSGTIPLELANLTNLQTLSLIGNSLTGTIPPELGNLTNLQYLGLGDNLLSGTIPPELGNLTNLQYLLIGGNPLVGTIPSELGNLTNLTYLVLSHSSLSGLIPSELGNLTNLEWLDLSTNSLSGTIPSELGNLTNLQTLRLGNNLLSGAIPTELGNLTNLGHLALSWNNLTGIIPPELGNLSSLRTLDLTQSNLTGSIPPEIGNLSNLMSLYLGSNYLSGDVPVEITNLTSLNSLQIGYNCLTSDNSTVINFLNSYNSYWLPSQTHCAATGYVYNSIGQPLEGVPIYAVDEFSNVEQVACTYSSGYYEAPLLPLNSPFRVYAGGAPGTCSNPIEYAIQYWQGTTDINHADRSNATRIWC